MPKYAKVEILIGVRSPRDRKCSPVLDQKKRSKAIKAIHKDK
jgi:hypothetical protein